MHRLSFVYGITRVSPLACTPFPSLALLVIGGVGHNLVLGFCLAIQAFGPSGAACGSGRNLVLALNIVILACLASTVKAVTAWRGSLAILHHAIPRWSGGAYLATLALPGSAGLA